MAQPGLSAQRPPDLSGTWVYAGAEASATRNGGGKGPARIIEVSGAAFNCGIECTIAQEGQTLTISRTPGEDGAKRPPAVLQIATGDGPNQPVGPAGTLAKWEGEQLVVTRSMGVLSIRQAITIERGQLVVASLVDTGRPDDLRSVQTYSRK
jgi:hypothetical protein